MSIQVDTYKSTIVGEGVRSEFPILDRTMNGHPLVFLDSAASSQKPQAVIDAIVHYYGHCHANVHRGVYQLSQEATDAYEQARKTVREFINAGLEEEIILTSGTTESINLIAHSFGEAFLEEGDEILVTGMEHHSNIVPWQMACERTKAKLKVIPVSDRGEISIDEFRNQLSARTKLVALVHVSNTLGTINPVEEIISIAHVENVPVLLDGAQAIPHMKVDVSHLDVDFYTFSGHKVYAPTGIGVLYGKKQWLDRLPPYQGGGEMIETVSFEKTTYNHLPHKFEAGTPNIAGAVGLGAALDFVTSIGIERINRHEQELLAYGTAELEKIEDLRIIGNAAEKAGVISFLLGDAHPYDIGVILDQLGIAVRTGHHCTEPLMTQFCIPGTVRASLGVYTTKEDIDRLVAGVQQARKMLL